MVWLACENATALAATDTVCLRKSVIFQEGLGAGQFGLR